MTYGTLEQLLAYPVPVPKKPQKAEPAGRGIEAFLGEKVEAVGTIVLDIQGEIERRLSASRDVLGLIENHYFYVKAKLLGIDGWPLGGSGAVEQRRGELEAQLDTLLNEGRREKINCVEQVASLKREFWRWLKEYLDLRLRVGLVAKPRS